MPSAPSSAASLSALRAPAVRQGLRREQDQAVSEQKAGGIWLLRFRSGSG
jgi:hypothetical protein